MADYSVTMTDSPTEDESAYVVAQLRQYNNSQNETVRLARQPENDWRKLVLLVRDPQGQIMGGMLAETNTLWGWLKIEYLWLDGSLRRHGLGRQLMRQAEEEAIKRGCKYSQVSTWSFQAPDFYQKMGYTIIGQCENYPPGATDYWLRKQL